MPDFKAAHRALLKRASASDGIELALATYNAERDDGVNATCPAASAEHQFGTDENPSMSIRPEDGACFCHACRFKCSSYVGLYQVGANVSYGEAVTHLWDKLVEPLVPLEEIEANHKALVNNPLFLTRLADKRGITVNTVKRFRLGWKADRLWIPIQNEFGFYVDVRKYDLMRRHGKGFKVISYGSRKDPEGKKYGGARLFPLESVHADHIVVCEGEMDTLLACQHGVAAITMTSGANTWRDELSENFKGKHVSIIPDNDKAGRFGAKLRAESIRKAGAFSVRIVPLPVKKPKEDLTDWVLKYGGHPLSILKLRKRIIRKNAPAPRVRVKRATKEDEAVEKSRLQFAADKTGLVDVEASDADMRLVRQSDRMWDALSDAGSFFRDSENVPYYAMQAGPIWRVEVGSASEFAMLLSRISPAVNPATKLGRFCAHHIMSSAVSNSKLVRVGQWSLYDRRAVYVFGGSSSILKCEQHTGIVSMPNAVNDDGVLIEVPRSQAAIAWDGGATIQEACDALMAVVKNIPCSEADRYLIVCWFLGTFMREYIKAKPLLRFRAGTAAGKTTASRLLSRLLYGEERLHGSATTDAARWAMARSEPILFFDNIESHNLNEEFLMFMLIVATGGSKAKRQANTDSGLVTENANCMLVTNGIEPIGVRPELINRMITIELNIKEYGHKHFNEIRVIDQLMAARSTIMSGMLKLIHKHVLPRINKHDVDRIARELPDHALGRFNSYFALMAAFLDALFAYCPPKHYHTPRKLVGDWLDRQSEASLVRHEETNEVLYFLALLVRRGGPIQGILNTPHKSRDYKGYMELRAQTRELLTDFRIMARHVGIRCPWVTESQLGARITDATKVLKDAGWVYTRIRSRGRTINRFIFMDEAAALAEKIR